MQYSSVGHRISGLKVKELYAVIKGSLGISYIVVAIFMGIFGQANGPLVAGLIGPRGEISCVYVRVRFLHDTCEGAM